jgi:cytoskeletal protein RodZ
MGQEVRGVSEAAPLSAEASIGRYLASQRRLRGISLEELATRTRIPLRSLERLEGGAFDRQADGFARSFVRTVADALGLDPDEAVTRLLREPTDADGESAAPRRLRRLAVAVGLALAVAGLGVGLWRWLASAPEDGAPDRSEVVTRRDAVRDLAEREAAGAER